MFNHPNGGIGHGVVVKCNVKTVDVEGDDGMEWRVNPMKLVHAITKQFVGSPAAAEFSEDRKPNIGGTVRALLFTDWWRLYLRE